MTNTYRVDISAQEMISALGIENQLFMENKKLFMPENKALHAIKATF